MSKILSDLKLIIVIDAMKLEKLKRTQLNMVATQLNMNFKLYKNKTLLAKGIQERVALCENTTDPVTLQELTEIDIHHLIIWEQNSKLYGAHVETLYTMFTLDSTINPFTIDYATGIQQAENKHEYECRYDMKNVEGLKELVFRIYEQHETEFAREEPKVPDIVVWRSGIERLVPEMYITHIVSQLEDMSQVNAIKIIDAALFNTMLYYRNSIFMEHNQDDEALITLSIINQCYIGIRNTTDSFTCTLELAHSVLSEWNMCLSDTVMELLFDYIDKVLASIRN